MWQRAGRLPVRAAGRRDGEAPGPGWDALGAPSWGEGLQVRLQEEQPSPGLHPVTASDAPATGDQGVDAGVQQRPHSWLCLAASP